MHPNLAYACLTQFCENGLGDREAVQWIQSDLTETHLSYQCFEIESNRIANLLRGLGIQRGEVVSIFLPRSPILISSFFSVLKLEAISCILFSTLGEEALYDRLENSASKVIITRKSLLHKLLPLKEKLPELKAIVVMDIDDHVDEFVLSMKKLSSTAVETFAFEPLVEEETPAFLQYTSGSTGKPKAALHVHGALPDMLQSFQEVMQLQADDQYWCTADPAWITGLVYGIIAPFASKTRQVQYAGGYNVANWLTILSKHEVNVWYTAPTALRMLMQENEDKFIQYTFPKLRRVYSVGEPLNPEVYAWGKKKFQTEIFDTWFQSETGSILVANKPGLQVKPGSMGVPRKGVEIIICDEQFKPVPTGIQGYLCVRSGWRSMFRAYYHKEQEYNDKFHGDLYFTGDLAKKDDDGYVWYISRADDVINTAGHLLGPFEVESALLEIGEIGDVAVIGVHDPLLHEKVIAFVTLKNGCLWSKGLELKCRLHVQNKVSSTAIPAEFHLVERIPKNQSGKILRRVLKAWYEGKDPGDLSTME